MRTRLAPSPTGALHLGNARTFLVNWALARQQGWEIVLRIEDLDGPRVKEGAAQQAIDDLRWLGIDWDEGPLYQLVDQSPYETALEQLAQQGVIYPCRCTRKQIEAAALSAPHGDEHELRYPGTCRLGKPRAASWLKNREEGTAWRLRVEPGETRFEDVFAGEQVASVEQSVGDFLVATKLGLPAYQLAVVVDDARQGIDQIVRGDDLLRSTHRQLLVQKFLGITPSPTYTHLPLVIGEDGRRLAKRHGDTRIDHYRQAGVRPERVVGLLGEWCGLAERSEMTATEFAEDFRLENLPSEPAVFTSEDDQWLVG
ncbi:MAG: tRNA glutamyl-Q(34) synthetase GluQRS [Lacipirellulaceae bacterium]